MIFHRLKIKNFGVYAGRHEIDLCPKKKGAPVILFGGLNGRGKTTLLDAIQLLFFGKLNRCSNRGRNSYDKFLMDSMTRGTNPLEGSELELDFGDGYSKKELSYSIKRSWSKENGKLQELFEVRKGGEVDNFLSENWLENVDRFLPFGLAELFFFDGEKIESLAEETTAKTILESAIKTLFGVDLISQLDSDLKDLEKKLLKTDNKPKEDDELKKLKLRKKEILKLQEKNILEKTSAAENLTTAEENFNEAEEQYRLQGGLMAEKRQGLESSKKETQARKDNILQELRAIASQAGPLLLVENEILALRKQSRAEQNIETQNLLLEELRTRDKKIIKSLKNAEIDDGSRMVLEALFEADIEERKKQSGEQVFLQLEKSDQEKIETYSEKFFEEIKHRIKKTLQALEDTEQEIKNIEEYLLATPDEASVEGFRKAMFEAESDKLKFRAAKELAHAEQERLQKEEESLDRKIEAKEEESSNIEFLEAEIRRKIQYAQKARLTLEKYKGEIISAKIGKVGTLILECFQMLLQKKNLVHKISISEKDFSISLFDKNDKQLELSRMSAGERQLLAVSILWGLARASNRQIPNIIDTPLGRLDGQHRDNIVRNYFTKASDQVIILSTDEEIDENLHSVLGNSVSRQYELVYSDESQSTQVKEGYFFN
jgi:DNA sulfur modification protein DndD